MNTSGRSSLSARSRSCLGSASALCGSTGERPPNSLQLLRISKKLQKQNEKTLIQRASIHITMHRVRSRDQPMRPANEIETHNNSCLDPSLASRCSKPESPGPRQGVCPERPEPFVTPEDAGEFLRISPVTIKKMARQGDIPAHALGTGARRRWRFRISELVSHMRCRVQSEPSSVRALRRKSS